MLAANVAGQPMRRASVAHEPLLPLKVMWAIVISNFGSGRELAALASLVSAMLPRTIARFGPQALFNATSIGFIDKWALRGHDV